MFPSEDEEARDDKLMWFKREDLENALKEDQDIKWEGCHFLQRLRNLEEQKYKEH